MYSDYIYKWLENALDYDITEAEFWQMTLAELERAIESKRRKQKQKAQEKASFDYILSDLIGRSVARLYSSSNELPEIGAVYPSLFDTKEIEEQKSIKKAELSAARFKQFAETYNNNLGGKQ